MKRGPPARWTVLYLAIAAAASTLATACDDSHRHPEAAFSCPAPGTEFIYSQPLSTSLTDPGFRTNIYFRERQGFDCHILSDLSGEHWLHAGVVDSRVSVEWRSAAEELWPLRAGKKSHASFTSGGSLWTIDYEVAAYDQFPARAGLFNAYKIIETVHIDGKPSSVTTIWWSPVLKYMVSYNRVTTDHHQDRSWELAAIGDRPA